MKRSKSLKMPFSCSCICLSIGSETSSNYYTTYSQIETSKKSSSSGFHSNDRSSDSAINSVLKSNHKRCKGSSFNEEVCQEHPINKMLNEYPWFHGTLSRLEAAELVLKDGVVGHGHFLVRQSTSRRGQHVLTFNYQSRATHIPIQIRRDGVCYVKNMYFKTIFDMLEHFRIHDIPVDSYRETEVTLTHFVKNNDVIGGNK